MREKILNFIDTTCLRLNDSGDGWKNFIPILLISYILVAVLSIFFEPGMVMLFLLSSCVVTGIFAYIWIELRGLRAVKDADEGIFTISDQISKNQPSSFSHTIWFYDYEDSRPSKQYSALEEMAIEADRELAEKIRSQHSELEKWPDKSIVHAMRMYQKFVGGRLDWEVRRENFVIYLALSELNGAPIKKNNGINHNLSRNTGNRL